MTKRTQFIQSLLLLIVAFIAPCIHAMPYFSITPVYLPKQIAPNSTGVAAYIITNNTHLNLNNISINNLTGSLSQNTNSVGSIPPVCTSPIRLTATGPDSSCLLQINVTSGIVDWVPQICTSASNPVYCSQPPYSASLTVAVVDKEKINLSAIVVANQGTGYDGNTPPAALTFPIEGDGNIAPTYAIEGPQTTAPQGVYIDNAKNLWVMDVGNAYNGGQIQPSIKKYALDATGNAQPIVTIQGSNTGLGSPVGLAIDNGGNIYVADFFNNAISIFAKEYQLPGTYNVTPSAQISGLLTQLRSPVGIAFDSKNQLYVVNSAQNQEFINPNIAVFAAGATGNVAPIVKITAGLNNPNGIAIDPQDNFWITDFGSDLLLKYLANPTNTSTPICTINSPTMDGPMGIVSSSTHLWVGMDIINLASIQQFELPSVECLGAMTLLPVTAIVGPATGLSRPALMAAY